MNFATHTPGPWEVNKDFMGPDTYGDGNSIPIFPKAGGVAICDVVAVTGEGLSRPDIQARAEANARLLAAAPDLLAALVEMLEFADMGEIHDEETAEAVARARAAITKAKGGQP